MYIYFFYFRHIDIYYKVFEQTARVLMEEMNRLTLPVIYLLPNFTVAQCTTHNDAFFLMFL